MRIAEEVDPHLEMAAIQRRVYQAGGPALLFENVKGCAFPCASNLFGTPERARLIFRDTYDPVATLVASKADPLQLLKNPVRAIKATLSVLHGLPKKVSNGSAPVMECRVKLSDLPPIVSWPDDGGPFVTLPQVYSEDVERPGLPASNLGMYRIQLAGNEYQRDQEIGLHYQIHRGIGVHHEAAIRLDKPFRVNIFVGGTPSMTLAAVMPRRGRACWCSRPASACDPIGD